MVDVGNIVHAADADGAWPSSRSFQPITVVFTLPEDTLPRSEGDEADRGENLPVEAFDRDLKNDLVASGTLSAIDNQIDPNSGTFRLKATFGNEDNAALFPSQFVNARLLVDTKRDAVIVPTAAVQRKGADIPPSCGRSRPTRPTEGEGGGSEARHCRDAHHRGRRV